MLHSEANVSGPAGDGNERNVQGKAGLDRGGLSASCPARIQEQAVEFIENQRADEGGRL